MVMVEDSFARFRRLRGIAQPIVVSVPSLPPKEEKQNYREQLPEALIELWEERAAIMEYEGGLSQKKLSGEPSYVCRGRPGYDAIW
jgi:hypothetical protein